MTVTCPNCGVDVYEVVADVYPGNAVTASDFEGIGSYESPKPGDPIECPACGDTVGMPQAVMNLAKKNEEVE